MDFCWPGLIAVWSFCILKKHLSSKYSFPLTLHWAYIACTIAFAGNLSIGEFNVIQLCVQDGDVWSVVYWSTIQVPLTWLHSTMHQLTSMQKLYRCMHVLIVYFRREFFIQIWERCFILIFTRVWYVFQGNRHTNIFKFNMSKPSSKALLSSFPKGDHILLLSIISMFFNG